jgi:hypothetical protein
VEEAEDSGGFREKEVAFNVAGPAAIWGLGHGMRPYVPGSGIGV